MSRAVPTVLPLHIHICMKYVCLYVFTLLCACSTVPNFETSWTVAHQPPLSMGFPRQEFWSGLPFPPPDDLPDPGIKPTSPALVGGFFNHCDI